MNSLVKQIALVAVVVTIAAIVLRKTISAPFESVTDAVENVNLGTPFADAGPIGTLGNATDFILFRIPSKIGGALGRGLFAIFNPGDA